MTATHSDIPTVLEDRKSEDEIRNWIWNILVCDKELSDKGRVLIQTTCEKITRKIQDIDFDDKGVNALLGNAATVHRSILAAAKLQLELDKTAHEMAGGDRATAQDLADAAGELDRLLGVA